MLDNLFDEAARSKELLALVVAGCHRNVHFMVLRHNLFQETKNSRTIDLNVTQLIETSQTALEFLTRLVFWVVNSDWDTPQSKPVKELKTLMVFWWLISTWEIVKRWGILQIVPVTSRPSPTAPLINSIWIQTMSLPNFYTNDLYINFPVVLKSCFILNCSDDIIKFFCDCNINAVGGNVKLQKKVQSEIYTFSREITIMEDSLFKKEDFTQK